MRANIWCYACKAHTEHERNPEGGDLWVCLETHENGNQCQAIRALGIDPRPEDEGCIFDSHRGQYIGEAVIELAEEAGFHPDPDNRTVDSEFYCEVWIEAENHLNQFAEDGYYFGSHPDNPDWGYWKGEDDLEFCDCSITGRESCPVCEEPEEPIPHYFNTGVRPENRPGVELLDHQVWRGGTLQIVFYLEHEPPEGAVFKFASPYPNADSSGKLQKIKVTGGGLHGDWAFYAVPKEVESHLCEQCKQDMGYEWFLGPVCGKCCRENHKKVTGGK
jgi:hypothetical protein